MIPGQQFLPVGTAASASMPETTAEKSNRWAQPGQQLKLPFDMPAQKPATPDAPDPHPVAKGSTLPMFMTGDEIRTHFQALDGDRRYASTDHVVRPSYTATHTTGDDRWAAVLGKAHAGERMPAVKVQKAREETDDEVFDRKYDEAHQYSLGDSIHENGFLWKKPVSLSSGTFDDKSTGSVGSQGKYQVLGGHHRLAVMSQDYPRQFMPVSWHSDIHNARSSNQGY